MSVVGDLIVEDGERARRLEQARAQPPTLGAPSARAPARRSRAGHQINVRLRRDHHRMLVNAAEALGTTPTQQARTFIVNGATRVVYERRRAGLD